MKKIALKLGVVAAVLGAVAFFVSGTKAEKVTAETIQVCSYYHDADCQESDSTMVYVPVAGRYNIFGLVERGTHSGNCQAREDFSLYVNGNYITTSYDPDSCEDNESTTYNENFGSAYLKQGSNSVAIYHAHSVADYGSTGEAESVSVKVTFSKPDTVNGSCGSSNGKEFESIPSTGLCSTGTASSISGNTLLSWTCYGLYGGSNATCSASVSYCGDGDVDSDEYCDDGNTTNGDGCSATCAVETVDPTCGDGNVDSGEYCDDGNTTDGDGCSATCAVETADPTCGDGNVDSGEYCDDGNTTDGDGCSATCAVETVDPTCGDGNVDSGEYCDDGNTTNGDGCSATCSVEEEKKEEPKDDDKECKGSIGNYIWNDADMDGVQDSDEKGIENIRVKAVWDGGDGKFGDSDDEEFRTDTNHNGHYTFEGLCEGEYKITVKDEDVKGLEQTYDPDGKKDNKIKVELESDKDSTSKIDFGYAGKSAPVTGPGEIALALALISGLGAVALIKKYKLMA